MKFETDPLTFDDLDRLKWLAVEWVQDAGGFAMVGLVLWVLNGLLYPVYDLLPDGRKRNRLVGPGMLLSGAIALTAYMVALGLLYFVGNEPAGARQITVWGRQGSLLQVMLEGALFLAGLLALIGF